MKSKDWQLTNLFLSKRLKELGIKQESLWFYDGDGIIRRTLTDKRFIHYYSAFTVAELGNILIKRGSKLLTQVFEIGKRANLEDGIHLIYDKVQAVSDTEANTRARLLIHLLENRLI